MHSLFQGPPFQPESQALQSATSPAQSGPRILLDITPWHQVFFTNLRDTVIFFRREPEPALTSSPGEFWPDVFVQRRLPLRPFSQSALSHIVVVVVSLLLSNAVLMRRDPATLHNPYEHLTVTYYRVSEYLPPIKGSDVRTPAKQAKKGEPAYAKQKMVSIRDDSESRAQTIVSPPDVRLPSDIRIPNMVVWNPVPAPVPTAMAVHPGSRLASETPHVVPPPPDNIPRSQSSIHENDSVVPPPPELDRARLRTPMDIVAREVVPPSPNAEHARVNTPNLPLPSVIEPPITAPRTPLRAGDLNIGITSVVPPAPKLPVPEQRARGSLVEGTAALGKAISSANTSVVPPPPSGASLPGASGGSPNGGQFIALSINPALIGGPAAIPPGNRSGTFAAGPEGKTGAPGTPDINGGGNANSRGGSGLLNQGGSAVNGPTGIYVERGPTEPSHDAVVVSGNSKPGDPAPAKTTTFASLARPKLADLARATHNSPQPESPSSALERQVFGEKRFYSMILNMPNLSSHGGSWIIRFAELKINPAGGDVSAPVATRKVDPAYSSELMRERIEGTVVLYAIIRANGAVEDVRVLRGVDERLDQSASTALKKWQFRPGIKNGVAVDVEAIVQIPFVSKAPF